MKLSNFSNEVLQPILDFLDAKSIGNAKFVSKKFKANSDAVEMQWLKAKLKRINTAIIPILNVPLVYDMWKDNFSKFETKINSAEINKANAFRQELSNYLQGLFVVAVKDYAIMVGDSTNKQIENYIKNASMISTGERISNALKTIKVILAFGFKFNDKDCNDELIQILPRLNKDNEVRTIIQKLGLNEKTRSLIDKIAFPEKSEKCNIM